ncbi:MAG: hypothetical protein WAT39_08265 [Planctomycetota bacterium]
MPQVACGAEALDEDWVRGGGRHRKKLTHRITAAALEPAEKAVRLIEHRVSTDLRALLRGEASAGTCHANPSSVASAVTTTATTAVAATAAVSISMRTGVEVAGQGTVATAAVVALRSCRAFVLLRSAGLAPGARRRADEHRAEQRGRNEDQQFHGRLA